MRRPMKRTWVCGVLASVLLMAGCADRPPEDGGGGLDGLPTWEVTRDVSIGSEDDPGYILTGVSALALAPGILLAGQPQDGYIRGFDRDEGRFLGIIGSPGEGPGEFQRLGGFGVLRDAVWAVDARAGLIHFFDVHGDWLDTRRVPQPEPPQLSRSQYFPLPDGGLVMPTSRVWEPGAEDDNLPWLRWTSEGSVANVLPGDRMGALAAVLSVTTPFGEQPVPVPRPFDRTVWVGMAPDHSGIVRADTDPALPDGSLRVVRYAPSGDTVAEAVIALTEHPIPAQVRDSLFEREVARLTGSMGSEASARRELSRVYGFPEHYPPLRGVLIGYAGRVWLELEGSGTMPWLVLEPDLNPLALVELPDSFRLMAADGDELWGVEQDDYGVPTIVRYRVLSDPPEGRDDPAGSP